MLQFRSDHFKTVHVGTKTVEIVVCSYHIAILMQSLKEFCSLFREIFTIL